ncbi:DUF3040 domain-containing protein [Actinacidiphila soli]|uniref:DUF3040 domain-containing protein n=1 Tax=Actinacidiphila soli TaxID=2487275 RepID=UPI000FCA6A61|nr:DUF3040 domain-containing protein [Actinacidiphila soli]
MDGPRLSPREQQILAQIESTLSHDKQLERELRTLHLRGRAKCAEEIRRIRKTTLVVLAVIWGVVLAAVVRTPTAGAIAALAVPCAVALVLGVTAVRAWARRRRP